MTTEKIIRKYSHAITKYPVLSLGILLVIIIIAVVQAGNVETKSMDNKDVIPDDIPVKRGFDIIEDEFSGSDSIMISIELDPDKDSDIRDLREPRIIKYIHQLTIMGNEFNEIEDATSISTLLKLMNNDVLPKSKSDIKAFISQSELYSNYLSEDFSHSVIRYRLSDDYNDKEIVDKLVKMIEGIQNPGVVDVNVAGDIATNPVMEKELGPDMSRTSRFSMIGILLVLLIIFGKLRYSLTPLSVIIVGIIWAYGFFGLIGSKISPATSGAMSMIMGIGIDFGIQTVSRFRQELKTLKPEEAMAKTLRNVFSPMFTTTLAALIGFQAMSMGNLSVMKELGTMMSYGVFACFLAAITVVPVISILIEKIRGGKNEKKSKK